MGILVSDIGIDILHLKECSVETWGIIDIVFVNFCR